MAASNGIHSDMSFPLKLHHIMDQEPHVLKWNTDNNSFRIIDEDDLVGRILQQYFRTARFSSFTRNLNIYGFKKIAKGEYAGSYYHPHFSKGGVEAIALMKRCPRKPAAGSDKIKCEEKTKPGKTPASKQASHGGGGKRGGGTTPAKQRPSLRMDERNAVVPPPPAPLQQQHQHHSFVNPFQTDDDDASMHDDGMSIDDAGFLAQGFGRSQSIGSEGEFNMAHTHETHGMQHQHHELALPPSGGVDDDGRGNHHHHHQYHQRHLQHDRSHDNSLCFSNPGTPFCSTPCQSLDHFQNPFTEDDDLMEWKKVLQHCGGNDAANPGHHGQPNYCQGGNGNGSGPNAYCINVPAGPLGVMIEKRGDKVCLSKITSPHSPLAHVPVGSQLVNLDGRDTSKLLVCQITRLDKSVRHRGRMLIFMACQEQHDDPQQQQPSQPSQQPQQGWVSNHHQPDAKIFSGGDIEMEGDSDPSHDPAAFVALPTPTPGTPMSTWLSVSGMQSFYETM